VTRLTTTAALAWPGLISARGRPAISIIHPFVYAFGYQDKDYFALTRYSETNEHDGATFTLTY
jgi:hypothetical protein